MPPKNQNDDNPGSRGRRWRRRVGGCLSRNKGKTIGFTSVAAPIAGYIINDLKKPDSVIRGLIGVAAQKFLPARFKPNRELDIGDKAEIIDLDKTEDEKVS